MRIQHYHNVLISTAEALILLAVIVTALVVGTGIAFATGWFSAKSNDSLNCPPSALVVVVFKDRLECIIKDDRDFATPRHREILRRKSTS